jgi:hypothetical protein
MNFYKYQVLERTRAGLEAARACGRKSVLRTL